MLLNQGIDNCEYQEKGNINLNSTNDELSAHEEPYRCWEPNWIQPCRANTQKKINNVCLGCSKFVELTQSSMLVQSPRGYQYLAHYSCVADIFQCIEYSLTAKKYSTPQIFKQAQHLIGCRQYLVNLNIQHPLSSMKFYRSKKKLLEYNGQITFLAKDRKQLEYQPNYIILPMKQLKFSLNLKPLCKSEDSSTNQNINFRVDLNKENEGVHQFKINNEETTIIIQFQVVNDKAVKTQIYNNMNYKYRVHYLREDFVKLNSVYIQFANNQTSKSQSSELSRSFIKQQLRVQSQEEFSLKLSPIKPTKFQKQEQKSERVMQSSIDQSFLSYIKTQIGSKQFQKKVGGYKKSQIDDIIQKIIPYLPQIVLHGYANYMLQSLLAVCSFEQRVRIISNVSSKISQLVCQQQGTFVFQKLILLLTHKEEFELICKSILKQFSCIAFDTYGHHFLRKLFQSMPPQLTCMFLPQIHQKFVEMAKSKYAVFVVKCALKNMRKIEIQSKEINYELKRFLDDLTLNTQKLINDQYGNYLIQESFQLIEPERLQGIFDYIIKFFVAYSCQNFSSNAVLNCLNKCWKKNNKYFIALKHSLDSKAIRAMYNNEKGNKILLEILDLNKQMELKDKICRTIRDEQASFNNRRWIAKTGKGKTGTAVTKYSSFSEACSNNNSFTKRKHYN